MAAAEKLQMDRSKNQATVLAQEIDSAAAVELISGDGDISTTGTTNHILRLIRRVSISHVSISLVDHHMHTLV